MDRSKTFLWSRTERAGEYVAQLLVMASIVD
jgi:hypothetical protein